MNVMACCHWATRRSWIHSGHERTTCGGRCRASWGGRMERKSQEVQVRYASVSRSRSKECKDTTHGPVSGKIQRKRRTVMSKLAQR